MSVTEQPSPRTGDRVDELLAELQDALRGAEEKCAQFVELLTGERPGPVVVPLGVWADESDPLAAFRLADGTVCYRGVLVEHVIVGEWFQVLVGGPWWRVVLAPGSESSVGLTFRLPSGNLTTEWFERGTTVRVACRPELLARRAESAELRAEARADQAEAAG